jgi:transcriptional regulator with XRE-family HTH domain
MVSGETPAVARRRVRLALREARTTKGYTQTDVAEAMEWSLSKVMRIELGEVTISPNDLRPLLSYLGVRDRAMIDDLVQAAKTSKQRRWWDESKYRDTMTPAMRQLFAFEAEAVVVRHFYPMIIPGRLQVREYSQAILTAYQGQLTSEEIALRLETRMRRRNDLLNSPFQPTVYLLLDESVLYREVGGARAAQLADLYDLGTQGKIVVKIMPFKSDVAVTALGTFELLYFESDIPAGDDHNAVMYRESDMRDEIVDDVDQIKRHRIVFERRWAASYSEEQSLELLKKWSHQDPTQPFDTSG